MAATDTQTDTSEALGVRWPMTQPTAVDQKPDEPPHKFDRERVVLYLAACVAIGMIAACYVFGYLIPADSFAAAIVLTSRNHPTFPAGCNLLFMEHANRFQSLYAIRFLGMLIGMAVTFVGMTFTVKGLEAGYSLDMGSTKGSASLKTASPGLVLATLGLALVAIAILHNQTVDLGNVNTCFN